MWKDKVVFWFVNWWSIRKWAYAMPSIGLTLKIKIGYFFLKAGQSDQILWGGVEWCMHWWNFEDLRPMKSKILGRSGKLSMKNIYSTVGHSDLVSLKGMGDWLDSCTDACMKNKILSCPRKLNAWYMFVECRSQVSNFIGADIRGRMHALM